MPHEALARLIHEGSVELVISFNWDSALERAYERLYGPSLPRSTLLKPPATSLTQTKHGFFLTKTA
jgi:hypothetical protein